ncbi:MAG TPA: PepSY domain-containing protein [Burkholderiaceae bacterium]|nr:PepSY domain-containing protein [Burkholderiaceae bacterium]HQR76318.1 PepSY domain-containing protein [Burkholderiaceae bacterium]
MKPCRIVAVILGVTFAAGAGAAAASESLSRDELRSHGCTATPAGAFMPESDLRAIVERLGYQVIRIGTDAACFEVLATDRNGRNFEIKFKGTDLKMISRYEVKGELQSVARQ